MHLNRITQATCKGRDVVIKASSNGRRLMAEATWLIRGLVPSTQWRCLVLLMIISYRGNQSQFLVATTAPLDGRYVGRLSALECVKGGSKHRLAIQCPVKTMRPLSFGSSFF